jgi:hypothetical protein
MRELNRRFRDHYGVPVRVIRWEPETRRVIYLREGYDHECFSPLEQFQRKFTELKDDHEPVDAIPADSDKPDLAYGIGLNEAIALQQVNYWLKETTSGLERDGVRWIYNTNEQWLEQFRSGLSLR